MTEQPFHSIFYKRIEVSRDQTVVPFKPLITDLTGVTEEHKMDIMVRIAVVIRRYINNHHHRPEFVVVGGNAAELLKEHPLTKHYKSIELACGPMIWGIEISINPLVTGIIAYSGKPLNPLKTIKRSLLEKSDAWSKRMEDSISI